MEGDSEIGDKTFFVAALFAMKTSRFVAFVGAMGALVSMTAIAVFLGRLFRSIKIPALNGLKVAPPIPSSCEVASRKGTEGGGLGDAAPGWLRGTHSQPCFALHGGAPAASRQSTSARVQVDQYVAVIAFVYFGVKLLRDSYRAPHR